MKASQYFGRSETKVDTSRLRVLDLHIGQVNSAPLHYHECPHLCIVLAGGYHEKVGRKEFERKKGDVIYLPAGVCHSGQNLSNSRSLVLELNPKIIESASDRASFQAPSSFRGAEINLVASRLAQEASSIDGLSHLAIESLFLEMLVLLGRDHYKSTPNRPPKWLEETKAYIEANFFLSPGLDELSNLVGRNPSHVARSFRLHFSVSIGDYVRRLKIEYAKKELLATDDKLVRIARKCGFSNVAQFANLFRRICGQTPNHFRKNHR